MLPAIPWSPPLPLPPQGKRVVVVGAGKTAHDVGVVVSKVAASTTLVARRGHWMAPQTVLGEPDLPRRCSIARQSRGLCAAQQSDLPRYLSS